MSWQIDLVEIDLVVLEELAGFAGPLLKKLLATNFKPLTAAGRWVELPSLSRNQFGPWAERFRVSFLVSGLVHPGGQVRIRGLLFDNLVSDLQFFC
jgi:hypothetical protein